MLRKQIFQINHWLIAAKILDAETESADSIKHSVSCF